MLLAPTNPVNEVCMYINIYTYNIVRTPSDPYLFRFDPYNDGVNPPKKMSVGC